MFSFLQGPAASYLLLTSSVISFLGSLFYGENESAAEVAPPEMVAAEWRSFHQKPEVNLVNEIFCQKKNKKGLLIITAVIYFVAMFHITVDQKSEQIPKNT